ncbi:pyridoxamine 5'-phosphate oxidase [Trematosphaeria pertusa]|uniref:pyridoxal 5'-phosphate synthase n=1 Tax=Trematosphaeria pertusa TaxID=390896 RepID=A0A6A6IE51_9PLEO|nr:pyridoxamine 5'-phosphate oxidase [Trematosphaeria pertusa]KAF2248681.1 pyridoxamine 5'-phosphate oxidase [Trematosphaeria pertusa]
MTSPHFLQQRLLGAPAISPRRLWKIRATCNSTCYSLHDLQVQRTAALCASPTWQIEIDLTAIYAPILMLIRSPTKLILLDTSPEAIHLRRKAARVAPFTQPKPTLRFFHQTHQANTGMLYSSKPTVSSSSSKRIFAPTGGSNDPGHAVQYQRGTLEISDLLPSPTEQFHIWFQEALSAGVYQPETVTLATASLPDGKPSARIVFMKELDERGFVIYSNWETSRKAKDVESNPQAALSFWWREVERQVRVEGTVERLSAEESQVYYDTRIRGSRIGAWASPQSLVLQSREELVKRVEEVEKRFEGKDRIPVPEFWGGIRVVPETVELWQGRESRLHDRFRYRKEGEGWVIERLSP